MLRYELSLCIGREKTNRGVTIKCHDDGISLAITFMVCRQTSKWRVTEEAFIIPTGATAVLKIEKPDKTKCLIDGKLEASAFVFELSEQAFTAAGTAEAEVSIYGANGGRVTSANFPITIPEECVCSCKTESKDYVDIVGDLIKAAKDAEEGAKRAAEAALQAQINSPKIGDNGNWFVWDFEKDEYVDTGLPSVGNPPSDEQVEVAVQSYMDENPIEDKIDEAVNEYMEENPVDSKVDKAVNDYLDRNAEYDLEYFDITDEGTIYLKEEYRGACPDPEGTTTQHTSRKTFIEANTAYIKSDCGYEASGSMNHLLPENLVIPEKVGAIAVVSLAPGMFLYNKRVKTITLPSIITAVPERFCDMATSLQKVYNTEQITTIGAAAFQCSGIKTAKFPNLTSLGNVAFNNAGFLEYADIGNVTSIGQLAFHACNNLLKVKGGANVTSIGPFAFTMTYRLNSVEFLPKLKSIGNHAFNRSHLIYDWDSLTGCAFGAKATSKQLNPTDIWSACTAKPTVNPVPTLLSQIDDRWKDKKIGTSEKTYSGGCVFFAVMHAYCALHNITATTADELADIAVAKSGSSDILDNFKASANYIAPMCAALGMKLDYQDDYDDQDDYGQNGLQKVYTAIASGAYVLLPLASTSSSSGHCALAYGVKVNKGNYELLIADSAFSPGEFVGGTDQGIKYSMAYQNMIDISVDGHNGVYIVSLDNTK